MPPHPTRLLPLVAALSMWASVAWSAPTFRYSTAVRGNLTTTGNTLGLAGTASGPSTNDGIGAFIDATGTLQVSGWPLGTTLDWTLASSSAVLDLPAGATILHAELVWGGTTHSSILGSLDAPIVFHTPAGLSHEVDPLAATASPSNGTMRTAGYYGRSADVTALLEGAGTYRVGRVPSSLANVDAAAGWALFVVYGAASETPKRMAIATIMEDAGGASEADRTVALDQLCVPTTSANRYGRVALATLEGDATVTGETLRFAQNQQQLGQNGARINPPGLTVTNPLISRVGGNDGQLDTRGSFGTANHGTSSNTSGARQGFDLSNIDTSVSLAANWTSALFRSVANNDIHSLLGVAMVVRHRTPILNDAGSVIAVTPTQATVGTILTVTATLQNTGDATAANGVFTMPVPAGLAYEPSSFLVNGANPPGGAVTAQSALATGVGLPNIGDGASATVRLQFRVTALPTSLTFAPRVVYQNQACAGTAVVDVFDPVFVPPMVFTECGNGRLEVGEGCDDGNTAAQDGCSATCVVETGWACGVNPASNNTPANPHSLCTSTCGDGQRALGAEACDDGNTVARDGCGPTCLVEYGWLCDGPAGTATHCATACGDGQLGVDAEACDDGNTTGGDGCGSDCRIESGWTCTTRAPGGGTVQNPDSTCATTCGDGQIGAPVEACDDGNTADLDGCSATCAIERGWACGVTCAPIGCGDGVRAVPVEACDDGNTVDGDGCSAMCVIEVGYSCEHTADDADAIPDSVCSVTCGDGVRASSEACDDGNAVGGDGCDACQVEPGWTCAGDLGAPSVCQPICGDGLLRGDEVCDDGNRAPELDEDPDGCAADCSAVDFGWTCEGEPSVCVTACGDGLVGQNVEACDDGNMVGGDGCAADCAEVEPGWSCGDPPESPSICEPSCGDGLVRGVEGCDDGNNDAGDGCSADCRVEDQWACDEADPNSPSACFFDSDGDGIFDDGDRSGDPNDNPCPLGVTVGCDDNCPLYPNSDQTFPDTPHPLCPPYDGPRTQGGGGGCAGGGLTPLWALLLLCSRRFWRRVLGFAGLSASLVAFGARAQEVDPRAFAASLSPQGVLGVDTNGMNGHLEPFFGLAATLANDEVITRVSLDGTTRGPLRERFITTLYGGLGLWSRLELAVGVPLVATTTSSGGLLVGHRSTESSWGLGDLRVALRARFLGPERVDTAGFGLGLAGELTLPTGGGDFRTDGGVAGTVSLVADWRDGKGHVVSLNAGYRIRPAVAIDDLVVDDEVRVGLGAEIGLGAISGIHVAMLGELGLGLGLGNSAFDDGGIAGREVQLEALGGLKVRATDVTAHLAAGAGLSEGYGAADFRVVLGVAFFADTPRTRDEPMVPLSVARRTDPWDDAMKSANLAPRRIDQPVPAEVFDAIIVADPDADSDGVLIPDDLCPDEPEDLDGFQDEDGCPDPDNDGDGIPDELDKCPLEKEVFNGFEDEDGCPDEGEARLTKEGDVLKIPDRIRFKSGSAELLPSDKAILEPVAVALKAMGGTLRIRIEGHTDNQGDREFNVDLAERRAWSVRSYLIEQGCDPERLFAKGFGPTRPIASNGTDAGRAQNRRVEFHVIKPGERLEGDVK